MRGFQFGPSVLGLSLLGISCGANQAFAQADSHGVNPFPAQPTTAADENAVNQLLTKVIWEGIPHEYIDAKRWGKTIQRWDGVQLRREGWKLETKRSWKSVNHGLWKKYAARLIDPEHQFSVALANVRPAKEDAVSFDLVFVIPLALEARQAQWVNGVQLYSISADVEAKIRLTVSLNLATRFELEKLPPQVVFRPVATNADLQIESFAVKRVSKIGGEFAEQVTQLAETQLDEFAAAQEPKIVEKINRAIAKNEERMTVDLGAALASPWARELWPTLSSDNQEPGGDD